MDVQDIKSSPRIMRASIISRMYSDVCNTVLACKILFFKCLLFFYFMVNPSLPSPRPTMQRINVNTSCLPQDCPRHPRSHVDSGEPTCQPLAEMLTISRRIHKACWKHMNPRSQHHNKMGTAKKSYQPEQNGQPTQAYSAQATYSPRKQKL